MQGPHTYADKDTNKAQCVRNSGVFKRKSSFMIFDRHADLKYKYRNRNFWCRGYDVDTVGKSGKKIEECIRNQIQEDLTADQITLKEYIDPFKGEQVSAGKK